MFGVTSFLFPVRPACIPVLERTGNTEQNCSLFYIIHMMMYIAPRKVMSRVVRGMMMANHVCERKRDSTRMENREYWRRDGTVCVVEK